MKVSEHHEVSTCCAPNQLSVPHTVDDDPHFIIHLPARDMDVCFNIDSKPGHILNVLSDAGTGATDF